MKAVTFHAIADIRVEDVPKPTIEQPTVTIVRLTASASCPWSDAKLVPIPDNVIDDQAILMSDLLPTAWLGADLAQVKASETGGAATSGM